MTTHCFGVHLHCRRQQQRSAAYRPPPNHTNIYGNWSNSIKWTSNLLFGKCSIYSYHRRSSIGISAIENVRLPTWLRFFRRKTVFFSISRSFADFSSIFGIFNWHLSFLNKNLIFSQIETKSQFARDDPAFLVLLILCVFGKLKGFPMHILQISFFRKIDKKISFVIVVTSIGFTWTLNLTFGQTIYCILYIIVVDVIIIGILTTTFTWFVANRYLRERNSESDIEWGYCFDVHLNAFFPSLVLLHFVQLIFFNGKRGTHWIAFSLINANCCCFRML